jgi:hypothetical protein
MRNVKGMWGNIVHEELCECFVIEKNVIYLKIYDYARSVFQRGDSLLHDEYLYLIFH